MKMGETKADPKTELQMKALVEQLSAYIETFHGGSAEFISFDGKVLKVRPDLLVRLKHDA